MPGMADHGGEASTVGFVIAFTLRWGLQYQAKEGTTMASMTVLAALWTLQFAAEPLRIAVLDVAPFPAAAEEIVQSAGGRLVGLDALEALGPESLLVLPECRRFPAKGIAPIVAFLGRKGHLLAVGGPAFETMLYEANGQWGTEAEVLGGVPPRHQIIDWSTIDPAKVVRGTNQPKAPSTLTTLDDGIRVEVTLIDPIGWDTYTFPVSSAPPADDNVLRFRGAALGRAKAVTIEVRERDGSRWLAVAPLDPEEREIGIHNNSFVYWRDSMSAGRGGEGDRVRFENVEAIVAGFALTHQTLATGPHGFTIRQVATGHLDETFVAPEVPKLEGLCPSYKTFAASQREWKALGPLSDLALTPPASYHSPVARAMHLSPDRDYTWQPLVKAYNTEGAWCATPIATTWRRDGATWTYCGFTPEPTQLAALASRIAAFLARGPELPTSPGLLLSDDEQGECIEVTGGDFTLHGQRWFAHGINFWPLYVSGMEPQGYFSHWLHPAYYIPELIDQDLATLESLGVNMVSIQYGNANEAPQLRDFLTRCGRHGIKANIWLSGAHPLDPAGDDNLSKRPFLGLLGAANLRGNPHVFAYDLAWEPAMGRYDSRIKYDHLFEAWLLEQYGSVERAEQVWKCPANRRNGTVTGPLDDDLLTPSEKDLMVAAYRRFADDLISRRYREVIRLVRSVDDTHLVGARTGYGGTGSLWAVPAYQFQVTSGAAHLDFISPEGYGYSSANDTDAVFVGQYARWAGNGKPVFWAEFGLTVWSGGNPALERQGAMYETFADIVRRGRANGWAGWWFPGGYRVDEGSDYGIVAPDRTLRPSALVLKRTAEEFKNGWADGLSKSIIVTPEKAPQGLAAIIAEHSKHFADACASGDAPAIRTAGTGTSSTDCPYTGVGGIPYTAPGPIEFLNAELTLESRNGASVVRVLNTGEAALGEDCVLVFTAPKGEAATPLPVKVERYEAVEVPVTMDRPFRARLRAARFGDFGEILTVAP